MIKRLSDLVLNCYGFSLITANLFTITGWRVALKLNLESDKQNIKLGDNYCVFIETPENQIFKNSKLQIYILSPRIKLELLFRSDRQKNEWIPNTLFSWTSEELTHFLKNQQILPIQIREWFYFQNNLYGINNEVFSSMEDLKVLILAKELKSKKKIEKAKSQIAMINSGYSRESISDEVKELVWRRDGGCCVKCGSRELLEFDHIIPLSIGGSNTARNLQILCEKCNREKGNNIS